MVWMRRIPYLSAAILPGVNNGAIYKTYGSSRKRLFVLRMPRDLCRPGLQRQLLQNWKTVLMWSYHWGLSFYFASLQGLRGEMSKRLQCGVGMLPKAALNNFLVYSLSLVNAACYSKPKVCSDSWSKQPQKLRTFFLGIGSTLTNLWIHKCVSHSYSCFRYHLILLWVFVLLKRIICWFNTTTSNVKKIEVGLFLWYSK